ncbi:hypothetical protein HNP65_000824 [Thermosipho japonicus]|uniref:Uncharacterized protein n=1 Tax=Thermosipho japonicus TaxID=90323 RepID=A0A841GFI1_9BACT|nr:hypothetical protein [Thermosipho japonicus]MBB6062386.1 hypothetical protein [Thermosipho japonicus]
MKKFFTILLLTILSISMIYGKGFKIEKVSFETLRENYFSNLNFTSFLNSSNQFFLYSESKKTLLSVKINILSAFNPEEIYIEEYLKNIDFNIENFKIIDFEHKSFTLYSGNKIFKISDSGNVISTNKINIDLGKLPLIKKIDEDKYFIVDKKFYTVSSSGTVLDSFVNIKTSEFIIKPTNIVNFATSDYDLYFITDKNSIISYNPLTKMGEIILKEFNNGRIKNIAVEPYTNSIFISFTNNDQDMSIGYLDLKEQVVIVIDNEKVSDFLGILINKGFLCVIKKDGYKVFSVLDLVK